MILSYHGLMVQAGAPMTDEEMGPAVSAAFAGPFLSRFVSAKGARAEKKGGPFRSRPEPRNLSLCGRTTALQVLVRLWLTDP